jgi:hypothetical protein
VTAKLAGDHPEFAGLRALLIRPDGYIAWATTADDPPPLARWLGPPSGELEARPKSWLRWASVWVLKVLKRMFH